MFTYAQVEDALASVHKIPTELRGAFRGRIKHFQRIGLVPASPGKGRKIAYNLENVYDWALCLELAEFGIDPTVIKLMMTLLRQAISDREISNGVESNERKIDHYFVFYPNMLANNLTSQRNDIRMGGIIVDDLEDLKEPENHPQLFLNRMGMINLGYVRREVEKALAAVSN